MVIRIERMSARAVPGYQAVVDHLRREFMLGRIRPGERLPAERQLSDHLGVARETLRQAIRVLEGGGHVVVTRGAQGGAVVQESFGDPRVIRDDIRARIPAILELTEYRSVIESAAAAFAAARHDAADLREIEVAHAELRDAESLIDSRHADTRFHLAVAAAAHNQQLFDSIEDARVRMFETIDLLRFDFVKETSLAGHDAVLAAIRAGDAAAAAEAMSLHLETTREEFDRVIEAHDDPGD